VTIPRLLGAGVVLLALFAAWEAFGPKEPLMPLGLFKDRNFTLSSIGVASIGFAMSAVIFPIMLFAQDVRGWTPTESSLILVPQALIALGLARWVGRRINQVRNGLLAGPGLFLMAVSIVGFYLVLRPESPIWLLFVPSIGYGLGSVFVWGPLATSATRQLPSARAGAGSGVYNTMRQVGSVLGSAAIAMAMAARTEVHLPDGPQLDATGALSAASADGYSLALTESMLVPCAVLVVGAIAAWFIVGPTGSRGLRQPRASENSSTSVS
jgi:hypothetical protein